VYLYIVESEGTRHISDDIKRSVAFHTSTLLALTDMYYTLNM